jgi:mRNA-degrading endonuclease RelE of RelBE toxin-antitoxin system
MTRRRIVASAEVHKQIRAIPKDDALAILQKLDRYNLTGVGDIKMLRSIDPPELRLKIGQYRLRFYSKVDAIEVISVTIRSNSYRA